MAQYGNSTNSRRTKRSPRLDGRSTTTREKKSPSRWRNGKASEKETEPWRRPEFMRSLGLLPPCTVEDVKQAYWHRVKSVHPDLGGNCAAFCRLQEGFERAIEYVKFHSNPLCWIAAHVDRYVVQQGVVAKIRKLGGTVDLEGVDWLTDSYGTDFSQLAEKVVGIQLRGPRFGDKMLAFLARQQTLIPSLRKLDLAFSHITDEGLKHLRVFCGLRRLDLQGTRITNRGLSTLRLPALEWLSVKGTSISWWSLMKLRWRGPALDVVTPDGRFKRSRNGHFHAAGNDMLAENGRVSLLARIAETRSWKHG